MMYETLTGNFPPVRIVMQAPIDSGDVFAWTIRPVASIWPTVRRNWRLYAWICCEPILRSDRGR